MAHAGLPALARVFMVTHQLEGQADEVVEVHALERAQALFIARHDAGGDALVVVTGLRFGLRRGQPHVLPATDGPLPFAGRGGVGGAAGVLEQADDVIAVQNAELRFEAQQGAILAHHAHTQRMEGANQHFGGGLADQAAGPFAHLGSRLVGECDGGNAFGFQPRLDEPGDLVGNDAGLARAGARQHEAGSLQVIHRFVLRKIQTGRHGGQTIETGRGPGR